MGYRAKSGRNRFTRRLPGVAAPVVAGMAGMAAFALANAPATALAAKQVPAHHSPATSAASDALLSAIRPAAPRATHKATHKAARSASYTVKSGDTLSAIARHFYQSPDYWPVLYWANHDKIKYANEIEVGQVLKVPAKPAKVPAPPSALGPAPAPAPVQSSSAAAPVQTASAPAPSEPAQATGTYSGGSGFQACVIAAESGGNSQVMNSSGHYGLYQFSSSTWAEYGGDPADFGSASVAEQNQVFNNAVAAGGASNWAPYDGC